ncbi:hypothetical protein VIS19158_07737, partial [Vibrio scophthalmi LMG 19158]
WLKCEADNLGRQIPRRMAEEKEATTGYIRLKANE